MIDDIRHGIRNSGRSYSAIAKATGGRVSERTVYNLFEDDANPTIGTLNAVAEVLLDTPDKNRRPCDGCRHVIEHDRLDFGDGETGVVACRILGNFHADTGCALRRTPDAP